MPNFSFSSAFLRGKLAQGTKIDRMVAAPLLNSQIPKCNWDIVGEHCSLLNAVTQSCPTDHGITIHEAETGLIPDLDVLPPLRTISWQN